MTQFNIDHAMQIALQHHQAGRLPQAEQLYRQVLAQAPAHGAALHYLGLIAHQVGRNDVAIELIRRAIVLMPDAVETYGNLGVALRDSGRLDEAIAIYRQAIALRPDYPEAYYNLGLALGDTGQLDEAITAYRQAIVLRPDYAKAFSNLGNALKESGSPEEARIALERAITLNPAEPTFHDNLLLTLHYHPGFTAEMIYAEHSRWNERHAKPLATFTRPHSNTRDPNRRLKIGYVSPDFRDHVVGRNVLPVVESHDRRHFEVFCYANHVERSDDPFTGRFRACADTWRNIVTLSDEQVTEVIRNDRIDILVDLALHTAHGRLLVFARKPSPVQVTWAGYPGTTGLKAMDYRLTDPYLDPPGRGDACYSEKSIRLAHSFWCFRASPEAPEMNSLPAKSNGFVTFGCLNNFSKVTAPAVELWAKVLRSVADSRMMILSPLGSHRERVLERFTESGVDPQRIEFFSQAPFGDYMRRYALIDIALDPLPYTGHSTSLDAFWMGVPVVTLAGDTVVSRGGVSIASNLGMTELIAYHADQYVDIAVRLAADVRGLSEMRTNLRGRMQHSPLMDEKRFTLDMENAYREMWRSWCEAPEHPQKED